MPINDPVLASIQVNARLGSATCRISVIFSWSFRKKDEALYAVCFRILSNAAGGPLYSIMLHQDAFSTINCCILMS